MSAHAALFQFWAPGGSRPCSENPLRTSRLALNRSIKLIQFLLHRSSDAGFLTSSTSSTVVSFLGAGLLNLFSSSAAAWSAVAFWPVSFCRDRAQSFNWMKKKNHWSAASKQITHKQLIAVKQSQRETQWTFSFNDVFHWNSRHLQASLNWSLAACLWFHSHSLG